MRQLTQIALLVSASIANAQTPSLNVNSRIKLPENDSEGFNLVSSLDQFLSTLQVSAEENEWIYQPQLLQTAILLEEIEGMEKVDQGEDELLYRPHLLNVVPLNGERHFVQVSYIALENGSPVIRANIELIAHRSLSGYLFSSPLVRNTKDWEAFRIDNTTFYYRGAMDLAKAKEYQRLAGSFDKRLESSPREVAFYFFEDDLEVQQYLGLPYKLEYNGEGGSAGWSTVLEGQEIYLTSETKFTNFDPHDLWHNRLTKVKPRSEVNRAVDEGIATLYGGCWGLSWGEMFAAFQEKIDVNEGTDWLDFREKKVRFETNGHQNPTDFMVNALFVKKIEAERGFSGVWDLLNAKDEGAYFEVLARLTGITKQNYNEEVWALLEAEMEEQKG